MIVGRGAGKVCFPVDVFPPGSLGKSYGWGAPLAQATSTVNYVAVGAVDELVGTNCVFVHKTSFAFFLSSTGRAG